MGSCILLAAYGWITLGQDRAIWRSVLLRATAAGLCVLLPMQAWMAHQFYTPFARVSKRIDASRADYVVVGDTDVPFSTDLVINPPFLDRRPIRLLRGAIDPALTQQLCVGHPAVALVGEPVLAPISAYYDFTPQASVARANAGLADRLSKAGCRVAMLD